MKFNIEDKKSFELLFNENTLVPNRNGNRKTIHRELYCLFRYLKSRIEVGEVIFPFRIHKSESPDFVLDGKLGESEGIEIAEITTQEYQRDLTEAAKLQKPISFTITKDYLGDSVEEEWATLASDIIYSKLQKLNDKFQKYSKNNLVLYSNTDLPNVDYENFGKEKLVSKLNSKLVSTNWTYKFDTICIMNSSDIYLNFLLPS